MLKGAIHTHSTYSDGEFTLSELREIFTAAGCDFVCLTDHAEFFDCDSLACYIAECRRLSDDRFRFIAGLEYSCERRMHVLGLGMTSLVDTTDPQEVIRHIERSGGVSIIAHPMESAFEWIESFDALPDGIETWNSKYDGRYAPRPSTFALLKGLQEREARLRAFYGQDLHWKNQYRGLFNVVRCATSSREDILNAFKSGDYFATKDNLELPSNGDLPAKLIESFRRKNDRSTQRRLFVKRVKKAMDRLGVRVPAPVKAHLRRIF
ncbi:MAG: PHP domain-containing protein [Blastocatellia bacterium]|nr:PHP domain-containing protein [Blastocatellia bacterium]